MKKYFVFSSACLLLLGQLPWLAQAEERVDLNLVNQLRDEGINRSKVMATITYLTDEIGSRLTGSPGLKKAAEWSAGQLTSWGLQKVHVENFAFGPGWQYERAGLRMLAPQALELYVIPKAWTLGTNGALRGPAIYAKLETDEDLVHWKGKLAGKIVLRHSPHAFKPHLTPDASRYSLDELQKLTEIDLDAAPPRRGDPAMFAKRYFFSKKVVEFLLEEKVLATLDVSPGEDGTIYVQGGGGYQANEPLTPPALMVATEQYNRLVRLLEKKQAVELELNIAAQFLPEDPQAAVNVLAELPGSDKKDEVVMLGAHLDSWHGAVGATDNAAGVAIVMEALRLLKAVGFVPRRTIRIGLWGGEEQNLLGSTAYVKQWIAARPEPLEASEKNLPLSLRKPSGPYAYKPLHGKLSAYFNVDNGAGKIRGIWGQDNAAIKPVFDAWLTPFHDLGATTTTLRKTRGTDHISFDEVGVPGFQFIQDELDYVLRTHHTNMDVPDKVQEGDLKQAAIIVASFVAHAANREQLLPRKPLPVNSPVTRP
jgi:hypothetical protein